ncbi:MAG: rRNA-processing protein las1 [Pleopsidium flavum]|nr:MAG: rRNA-processing protein las1 [Pleopsidium flavum]
MFWAAREIGLPASFVELRHQATHEELPALLVLRQAATRSLHWLWQYYWKDIDIRSGTLDDDDEVFADGVLKLKERFRHILRPYMEARLDAVKKKAPAQFLSGIADACQQCVQICKSGEATTSVLVATLLESGFLVPTSKTLGSGMESEFSLWDDLLKKLTQHQRPFLRILTDEMSIMIIQPTRLDISIDIYREAVYMWLVHIITSERWTTSRKRGNFNASCVISTCLMNPNHWSRRLATVLAIDTDDEFTKAQWANLVRLSNAQYEQLQLDGMSQGEVANIKEEVNRVNAKINEFEQQASSASQGSGWVKWQGPWVPKPIGMI